MMPALRAPLTPRQPVRPPAAHVLGAAAAAASAATMGAPDRAVPGWLEQGEAHPHLLLRMLVAPDYAAYDHQGWAGIVFPVQHIKDTQRGYSK